MTRQEMADFLMEASGSGQPFRGSVVSTPSDLLEAEKGGASWAVVTHACMVDARVPASVIGLLPYANANAELLRRGGLAREARIPLFAGVFASDQFTRIPHLLKDVWNAGFRAVQNFPSVGLAENRFAAFLGESGMDYDREVAMISRAREMDFFVSAVVFSPGQAEAMIAAGADMLVFHPGVNADGEFRGGTQAVLDRFAEIAAAARRGARNPLLARLAFERESREAGIQYDCAIAHGGVM